MGTLITIFSIMLLISLINSIFNKNIRKSFKKLGNMTGKSKSEIIKAVGNPTSVSSIGNGFVLLQWQKQGYHIAIQFDENEKFAGITHEFSA